MLVGSGPEFRARLEPVSDSWRGRHGGRQRTGRSLILRWVLLLVWLAALPAQAETVLLEAGDSMSYVANTSDPGFDATWFLPGFVEGPEWTEGVYGVGHEGAPAGSGAQALIETEVAGPVHSIYTRASFSVDDVGGVHSLFFGADYDDGVVVWINGVEVYRSAEMRFRDAVWDESAADHESSNGETPEYEPLRDISAAGLPVLQNGSNLLAVGIWNKSVSSEDLVLVPQLRANRMLRRGPYLQQGTSSSMVVRWRTAEPAASRVLYGADPANLDSEIIVQGPTVEHEVTVSGLEPGTRYFYAVGTSGEILAGGDAEHFFHTSQADGVPKPTRVWVIGDSGLGNMGAIAVRDAFRQFNGEQRVDVWVHAGDVSQIQGTDLQYETQVFDMFPELLRTTVLWPTIGNHDQYDDDLQTWPYYNVFTLPQQGEAGGIPSSTEKYYSHDFGNIHFVVLNSMEVKVAGFGAAMLNWLEADLQDVTEDWIIAYWHHPPYSKGGHDSDDPFDSNGSLVWMRQHVLPVLEDHGVDLVLTGHSHSYERSYLLDGHYGYSSTFVESMKKDPGDGNDDGGDGAYVKPYRSEVPYAGEGDGAVYAVAGSASTLTTGKAIDLGGTEPNHPAMVLSSLTLGSVVLDVNGNRLDSIFLDDEGVIRDRYTIFKGGPTVPPEAQFDVAPRVGQAPVAVSFTDLSTHGPTSWNWDLDDDGVPESTAPAFSIELTAAGLHTVQLSVENSAGIDEETKPDYLCITSGTPEPVTGLKFDADSNRFFWNAAANATAYDVVRGDLAGLLTGGSTGGDPVCLENDDEDLEASDSALPDSGHVLLYLAGATNCAGEQGTFASGSPPGTAAWRDGLFWPQCPSCATGTDDDGDGVCIAEDNCPDVVNPGQQDGDGDGVGDDCDGCPSDPDKTEPGLCGCGVADTDSDGDETPDCDDLCPFDPEKIEPGLCGCGVADTDSDGDQTPDCDDLCPLDPNKVDPGVCGCGASDRDDDQDGTPNCIDGCPSDPDKVVPGICGCGEPDVDTDSDGVLDCNDLCPLDPDKIAPGQCGCGVSACWLQLNSGTIHDLQSVHFPVHAITGFVVGDSGTLLKTENGGNVWTMLGAGTSQDLNSVQFLSDGTTGYIVGDAGTILKSTTGGAFWLPKISGTSADLQDVQFVGASGIGYAVGDGGVVLKSSDGGDTWVVQQTDTQADLLSVDFPAGHQAGYIAGEHGTLLGTTDGGEQWLDLNPPGGHDLTGVSFPSDDLEGHVVGLGGTVLATDDGGDTWSTQDPQTTSDLLAVYFVTRGATVGYAVGAGGLIRRTDDGGQLWEAEFSVTSRDLLDVHFPSKPFGFAVGRDGVIRKRVEE